MKSTIDLSAIHDQQCNTASFDDHVRQCFSSVPDCLAMKFAARQDSNSLGQVGPATKIDFFRSCKALSTTTAIQLKRGIYFRNNTWSLSDQGEASNMRWNSNASAERKEVRSLGFEGSRNDVLTKKHANDLEDTLCLEILALVICCTGPGPGQATDRHQWVTDQVHGSIQQLKGEIDIFQMALKDKRHHT